MLIYALAACSKVSVKSNSGYQAEGVVLTITDEYFTPSTNLGAHVNYECSVYNNTSDTILISYVPGRALELHEYFFISCTEGVPQVHASYDGNLYMQPNVDVLPPGSKRPFLLPKLYNGPRLWRIDSNVVVASHYYNYSEYRRTSDYVSAGKMHVALQSKDGVVATIPILGNDTLRLASVQKLYCE